ncbi:MAG: Gfo/Idh/MocA family oxidoreductase [Ruminococcaceae bacterium]|nr:Gfo/Idh/MocA family oxidoreductase [Oscillospiraceae bacterium]
MNKIRWAVMGAGGIANIRGIPGLLECEQVELVAVMDKSAVAAENTAKKYNIPHWFTDEEEMLRTVPCDAVYIATPVPFHYSQAMLALQYGAHVLTEKPFVMKGEDGRTLLEAFKTAGKHLSVGYMMGRHNLHQKAKTILHEGGIGDLTLVRMLFTCWYPDIPGAWRQKKALGGGGCIVDLAVHCMELFTSITGEDIQEVKAYYGTNTFQYEVEDSAVIAFRTASGVMGHIDVNFNIPDGIPSRLEMYGTAGSIVAEGTLSQTEVGILRYAYKPDNEYDASMSSALVEPELFYGESGNLYRKQFEAFNEVLNSGKSDYTMAERALKIQYLTDEIYAN